MNNTPPPRTETDLFEATKVSLEYGNQRLLVAFSDGFEYALKHSSKIKQLETELTAVTEQRDRLIEAIKEHKATMQHRQEFHDSKLYEALQSLTTKNHDTKIKI